MLANHSLALMTSTHERILLSDLIDEYLSSLAQSSAKNLSYFFNDFLTFCTDKYINDITIRDIQKYINYKQSQNLKSTTTYKYLCVLRVLFNYAVSHKYLNENPCERCCSKLQIKAKCTHNRLFKKIHQTITKTI